jgi:hypothetical protein
MKNLCKYLAGIMLGVLAAPLFATALLAQTAESSLHGQVTDQSGAAVPAINVILTGLGGATLETRTDEQGRYTFRSLPPGTYSVQIQVKGFAKFEKTGIVVAPGKTQAVDAKLEVALEKQEITVEGDTLKVGVSPENNASSLVIRGKDLQSLSDDPDQLQAELQALAGPSAGPNGGQIYIDGFSGGQLPPKEAIREIRVNQNPFTAEHSNLGYGRIEVLTKPGMGQFHGGFFLSGNTSALNSRNPFVTELPSYHSEFFNGNLGGPLSKKASFFFDAFRRNINDTSVVSAVILDPNLNQTPFSQAVPNPRRRTNLSPRVDYQVSTNNTLTARYQFWQESEADNGIGQFSLPLQAYDASSTEHTFQVSDTQVVNTKTINETRFRYIRSHDDQTAQSLQPTISVLGAFTGGGNRLGKVLTRENRYELQNYTSISLGRHFVKFGGRLRENQQSLDSTSNYNGTFTFSSLAAYQITEQGLQQGLTLDEIRVAGGGASQFLIVTGNPRAAVRVFELGLYGEDDWRIRPNMTLSLGLRYETQNHISDHADIAPRIGFAWGLGGGGGGRAAKTVLRAGAGIFYDRFGQGPILNVLRLNGINQQQYVVPSPDFYPNIPPLDALTENLSPATVYQVDPNLRAPYTIEAAVGLERQVARNATVSVTYLTSHGVHQFLSRNINAPLPGTYDPADPSSGERPFGNVGNIYQYESDGLFNQNQLITNFNIRGSKVSFFGFYSLGYANSNTSGVNSFPVNQYDLAEDYGRAAFDIRHRLFVGGSVTLPLGFSVNPFVVANSGRPFDITLGQDLNGDSIFNDRPAFATDLSNPNVVVTRFGAFNTMPLLGEPIIPPSYGGGPSAFSLNMRLSKTFGFGKKAEGGGDGGGYRGRRRGGGLGGRGLSGGGGWGGWGGGENSRYSLTFSISARNILNHVNLGTPIGSLSSPLFGQSNSIAGGPFSSQSANRRIDMQVRFRF